jgi:hypothetical protein
MRFRRIYWVTEQFDADGKSEVTGVFTSIPDLIDTGLGVRSVCAKQAGFRVSLCELDSGSKPILSMSSPDFAGFEDQVRPVMQTGEISHEEYNSLADALRALRTV